LNKPFGAIIQKTTTAENQTGIFYALAAFSTWGLFPLYWKLLREVPHTVVLAHRIFWSATFFAALLKFRHGSFKYLRVSTTQFLALVASSILISLNWFAYTYAMNTGQVLQTSLGYFITPLVSVLLGLVFLKEKLRFIQWMSLLLAALGVFNLALHQHGQTAFPSIALTLAFSFGLYGFVRKIVKVNVLNASTIEGLVLALPAAFFITTQPSAVASVGPAYTKTLFVLGGVITATPLLWFAEAGKRLPLSTLGILQYITPSLNFLLAVFVYGEAFTPKYAVSFGCIWIALFIYTIDLLNHRRKN
jgi:chloramphenicol-sensitive protein RarD